MTRHMLQIFLLLLFLFRYYLGLLLMLSRFRLLVRVLVLERKVDHNILLYELMHLLVISFESRTELVNMPKSDIENEFFVYYL